MSQFPHAKLNHQKILKKKTKSSCLNAEKKLISNGGRKKSVTIKTYIFMIIHVEGR
jgi:hypothetical protein